MKAAEQSHQILALFGGKAPHQHSFVHGSVAVAPTTDKITGLLRDIRDFVQRCMMPDTELMASCYDDYFHIGKTVGRFLSFGLFRFGEKNESPLWKSGILEDNRLTKPRLNLIQEDISHAWFHRAKWMNETEPEPHKPGAYTWTKAVLYQCKHFEGGPLARMVLNGYYASTMDRIVARSLETLMITELMEGMAQEVKTRPPKCRKRK